ncbi:hypothetical protein COHA_009778 [Chlorella ohadii]|uniref:Uncharacterized protein n=1 Tax=Chlorella ohadii TaxID=2649997 RepID=A0AAD5DHN8_9CHLO|nr:hypothetical protein COHA_009778 [Chlorella ohadii]
MAQGPETVEVHGVFGDVVYSRGGSLRVPFQRPATFHVKDDLKALGFVCRYADKEWELPERYCSEQKERQLRYLLREGELPPESDGEGAAAANAPQGGAAAAAGARAAVPATPEGGRKRQREREPEERRFLGGAVVMRREAGGRVLLQGAPLAHIEPMLRRIFHFERLPAQGGAPAAAPGSAAAAAAAPAAASPQHRWRSSFTLTDAEAQFVEAVLEHRQPKMLQGRALDDKEVIPPGAYVPARFRPHAPDGTPLKGPYKTRNGEGHNIGRQFFSTFRSGAGQFLWADGTEPFSEEAFDRNAAWAEDVGIAPPGMGRWAQLIQGMFVMGGWEGGREDDGWDEAYVDEYGEASGFSEEESEEEEEEEDSEEEEEVEEEEEEDDGGED